MKSHIKYPIKICILKKHFLLIMYRDNKYILVIYRYIGEYKLIMFLYIRII